VEWVTDCIEAMLRKAGKTTIEATPAAQDPVHGMEMAAR